MNLIAKFSSADAAQILTVIAATGKSGINVKASIKTGKGKGADRAVTGGRASFDTEPEAKVAFDALCAEAVSRGWTSLTVAPKRIKNAFSLGSLPAPVVAVATVVDAKPLTNKEKKAARRAAAAKAA